jgi:hypothetical protein
LAQSLNNGILPAAYYALAEQVAGDALKQRSLVLRHQSTHRIVAIIEIISPGNKSSTDAYRAFLDKAVTAAANKVNLLILDLFPPGPRDPQGIHDSIWGVLSAGNSYAPTDKPLTLASYDMGPLKTAYVEAVAVGEPLPDMPLIPTPGCCMYVPLEQNLIGCVARHAAFHSRPAGQAAHIVERDRWRFAKRLTN